MIENRGECLTYKAVQRVISNGNFQLRRMLSCKLSGRRRKVLKRMRSGSGGGRSSARRASERRGNNTAVCSAKFAHEYEAVHL
jgi:hypothetical protein